MKLLKCCCIIFLVGILFSGDLFSAEKNRSKSDRLPNDVNVSWAKRIKQGYNLRVWMSNQMVLGAQAWDGGPESTPDGIGCEYPRYTRIEHLYGGGPRVGAIIDGRIRVSEAYNGSDARHEILPELNYQSREHFWRTKVGSQTFDTLGYYGFYFNNSISTNRAGVDDDIDGLTDEDELDGLDNDGDWNPLIDDIGKDGLPDSTEVSCNGKPYDPISNPDPAGDNYDPSARDTCHPTPDYIFPYKNNKDIYTERNGIADHGEPHVDEDYGAISNNDLICSATDTFIRPIIAGHVGLGAKITQKSYTWNYNSSSDAFTILDYAFVNIGNKNWQDAYFGYFIDPDIGSVDIAGYSQHNYSAFDTLTRTAYSHNPVDFGSTPLGLTLLSSSQPLDSLRFIWRWADFTTLGHIDPGTNDSLLYTWMSGSAFPDELISPNQDPNNLSDTRFIFSIGKFQMAPLDTVREVFALVSGKNIDDMLNNAKRAKRIYQKNGFIMPVVQIADSGAGRPIKIFWNAIEKSPFGSVTGYRVYHGINPGVYTDSIDTNELSVIYNGLDGVNLQYFMVVAIDDHGNLSATSDEVSNIPSQPLNFQVTNQQRSIRLSWQSSDLDIAGYNIYRRSSVESTFTKLNTSLFEAVEYIDIAVWGDKIYYYKITPVDIDNHEGISTDILSGRLIPPAKPRDFIVGPGKTFLHLNWVLNQEEDFVGYNIYRKSDYDTTYTKLNQTIYTKTDYIDTAISLHTVYDYYVEAVDSTDAASGPADFIPVYTVLMDKGILAVNHLPNIACVNCFPDSSREVFYNSILYPWKHTVINGIDWGYPYSVYTLGRYSTVLWLFDSHAELLDQRPGLPLAIKGYLLGGGRLLIMGRKLTMNYYPYWFQFLSETFGINPFLEVSSTSNFIGAYESAGYPGVKVDSLKSVLEGGRLKYVERFMGTPQERVIYSFKSNPYDSQMENDPVGIRAIDQNMQAYYLSFPLYRLEYESASLLISKILNDFGEIVDVKMIDENIPKSFNLYNAFPNPFNPITKIRFDIPEESDICLIIYDVLGREVSRLIEERKSAGKYEFNWNAGNLSSGVYFYRLEIRDVDGSKQTLSSGIKKIILVK